MAAVSAGSAAVSLSVGTGADIPFVMATERLPGYGELVGRWERERHEAALADPRFRYLVAIVEDEPAGFAILEGWGDNAHAVLIRRLAIARPGAGLGRAFVSAIADAVFTQTPAHRLHLGHFPENERAHRAYAAAGFVTEGIARGSAFFGGVYRDETIMSLLRPEWAARRGRAA